MNKLTLTNKNIWKVYSPVYAKITPTMQKSLLLHAAFNAKGSVLDAGTGVGKLLPYLKANDKVKEVLGIDANEHMLNESKQYEDNTVKTILGDVQNHQGSYDTIISLNVLYTLNDPLIFLKKAFFNLKEKGTLILSSINKTMNMQTLTKIADLEFMSCVNSELLKDYKLFKECNYYLTSQSQFKPKLFDMEEMILILEELGFKIRDSQTDYKGTLFTIIAQK